MWSCFYSKGEKSESKHHQDVLWPFENLVGDPGPWKLSRLETSLLYPVLVGLTSWSCQELFNPVAAVWQGEPISKAAIPSLSAAAQPFILLRRQCVVKSVMRKEGGLGTVETGKIKKWREIYPIVQPVPQAVFSASGSSLLMGWVREGAASATHGKLLYFLSLFPHLASEQDQAVVYKNK